jgi:hypothetical protein
MPNDCWNHITITCENPSVPDELNSLVMNELQHKVNDEYIYNETVEMKKRGRRGIMFYIWSPWNPDFEWLEGLILKYPNCWIKNEWSEEGGFAGVWIGRVDNNNEPLIESLTWDDICIEGKHYLFMDETEEKADEEALRKMCASPSPKTCGEPDANCPRKKIIRKQV